MKTALAPVQSSEIRPASSGKPFFNKAPGNKFFSQNNSAAIHKKENKDVTFFNPTFLNRSPSNFLPKEPKDGSNLTEEKLLKKERLFEAESSIGSTYQKVNIANELISTSFSQGKEKVLSSKQGSFENFSKPELLNTGNIDLNQLKRGIVESPQQEKSRNLRDQAGIETAEKNKEFTIKEKPLEVDTESEELSTVTKSSKGEDLTILGNDINEEGLVEPTDEIEESISIKEEPPSNELGVNIPNVFLPDYVLNPTPEVVENMEGKEPAEIPSESLTAPPASTASDESFQETVHHIKRAKRKLESHEATDIKLKVLKKASRVPVENQKGFNNQGAHLNQIESSVDQTEEAKEALSPETFKALLSKNLTELENELPKNESAAKEFKKNKPIEKLKENVRSNVNAEKEKISLPVSKETKLPNAPESNQPTEEPMEQGKEEAGKKPQNIDPKKASPKPIPDVEISIEKESKSVDDYMRANKISEEQLENSNEPQFLTALESKKSAQKEAAAAPGKYREGENETLTLAQNKALNESAGAFGTMFSQRQKSMDEVFGKQQSSEKASLTNQKAIHKFFEENYNETKKKVNNILEGLTNQVENIFQTKVDAAKNAFEKNVENQLEEIYGWTTLDDWIFGEDTEAIEAVFAREKTKFISAMNAALDEVANIISTNLNEAIRLVNEGRKKADEYYTNLSEADKKTADESKSLFDDRFNDLESTVRDKEKELAESLAKSYKENADSLRASFDSIKKEVSKSWLEKAADAIAEVIEVIKNLADTLYNLLSAVVEAISAIIADPIRFLSNLISGIKQGFENFAANIRQHLIGGLITWLTGALGPIGIQMPEDLFSIKGIFSLISQILGFTWDRIKAIGIKVVGEPVMKILETGFEMVTILQDKGLLGLWEYLKDQFNDLKETVIDTIQDIIQSQVIQAGIKWIMGLLTPAGAFIKAALAIIDIVKFFIQKAAQVIELVNAFIGGIKAVASGGVAAVATAVENALVKAIPVVIGFLASLLGISGLTDKVIGVIKKIQQRVEKAIVKLWEKIKQMAGKLLSKMGLGKEEKEKGKGEGERDVKVMAMNRLNESIDPNDTEEQIQQKIVAIKNELQSDGLTGLRMKEDPENEGEYFIDAAASPFTHIIKLINQLTGGRTPTARCQVVIKAFNNQDLSYIVSRQHINKHFVLSDGTSITLPKTYAIGDKISNSEVKQVANKKGELQQFAMIERSGGSWSMGGALLIPKPGDHEIKLITWNTDKQSFNSGSNASHAEYQFLGWLKSQPNDFLQLIEGITVNINLSPCDDCCAVLKNIVTNIVEPALLTTERKKIFRENLEIKWTKPFCRGINANEKTTNQGVALLESANWKITGQVHESCNEGFDKKVLL